MSDGKNGYLELSNLGKIQMRGEARTWGKPTTCTIVNLQGVWYASITVQCTPIRETGTGAVGLDFGCLTAVATSARKQSWRRPPGCKAAGGTLIENPRLLATTKTKISIASKAKRRSY